MPRVGYSMRVASLSMAVVMVSAGIVGVTGSSAAVGVGVSGVATGGVATSTLAAKPVLPEQNKNAGPRDDEGYNVGSPQPTYQWHGCDKYSTFEAPRSDPDPIATGQMPKPRKGTKQGKVKFTTLPNLEANAGWTIKWWVKNPKKWRICGAQVSGGFTHSSVPGTIWVAQAGYTSSKKKGTTTKAGAESLVMRMPKNDRFTPRSQKEWGGKMLATETIYAISVYIKKKK